LGGTDLRRIPGVVTRVEKQKNVEFYEVTTAYGILNDCLRASALEDYAGVIDFDPNSVKNKIALTLAAQLAGQLTGPSNRYKYRAIAKPQAVQMPAANIIKIKCHVAHIVMALQLLSIAAIKKMYSFG
jgi:hypothetical protein